VGGDGLFKNKKEKEDFAIFPSQNRHARWHFCNVSTDGILCFVFAPKKI
jgi:hypothetical protein